LIDFPKSSRQDACAATLGDLKTILVELLKESWATDDGKNSSFTLSPEHIRVFLLDGDTKELEHLTTSAGRTANDGEDADIPLHDRHVTYFVVEYFHNKVPAYMYRTVKIVQLKPSV